MRHVHASIILFAVILVGSTIVVPPIALGLSISAALAGGALACLAWLALAAGLGYLGWRFYCATLRHVDGMIAEAGGATDIEAVWVSRMRKAEPVDTDAEFVATIRARLAEVLAEVEARKAAGTY